MNKFLWLGIIALFAVSCGAPKVMTSFKTDAENFTTAENYLQATEAWKQHFNQTPVEQTAGVDFATAAKTACKSNNTDLALSWFDQARYKNYADAEMYSALAGIYREKGNISKELNALEYVVTNYNEEYDNISGRLFDVYAEIKSFDSALQVWETLDSTSKNDLGKLNSYFQIKKQLKDTLTCDAVSLVILEKNPGHTEALDWNAKKFYWKGENRYQQEMAKYEKNKTTKQYRILLKELDKATADFKLSLSYFEKLWEMEDGKKYASYFANIYARFGDEKKSKDYQKYM